MDLSLKSMREIPSVISYHYKEGNLNWPMIIYISLVHTAAVGGLFRLTECSYETLMWAFVLWPIRYVITNEEFERERKRRRGQNKQKIISHVVFLISLFLVFFAVFNGIFLFIK